MLQLSQSIRGINYDVGTKFGTMMTAQAHLSTRQLIHDFKTIASKLYCNAIHLYGTDVERLKDCAAVALKQGLAVWLQPRLIDAFPEQALDHLAQTAEAAERLRQQYKTVTLDIGCELTAFMSGIIPGDTYVHRIASLAASEQLFRQFDNRLNAHLAKAIQIARANFNGKISYAAALWETVDWTDFDIIGLDYYHMAYNKDTYVRDLRKFRTFDKPIVITEFGCCSYQGAEDKGPAGYDIVDWSKPVPELNGRYIRDEHVQADYLAKLIKIFEEEKIDGYFAYVFSNPDQPYSPEARYDLDMASFGVVKVTSVGDGDVTWEPKEAFHTIATMYSRGQAN